VRQIAHHDTSRRCGRVDAGPAVIAASHLGRINAEFSRRRIDEVLGNAAGDWHTHTTIRAHCGLVLEHHAQPCAKRPGRVRRTGQGDRMQTFAGTRARVQREGADLDNVIDLEAEHRAVRSHRDRGFDDVAARMDVVDEGLQPVRNKLDRAPEQHGRGGDGNFVVVQMQLDAERAANVGHDHAHIRFRQTKQFGVDGPHLVRHLRRVVDRQAAYAGIELGQQRACLQRHPGVARELQRAPDDMIGAGESGIRVAGADAVLESDVAVERRMQRRIPSLRPMHRLCREQRVGQRLEFPPRHLDQGQGILRQRPGFRNDDRHRLALPQHALHGERRLRRRTVIGQGGESGGPCRAHRADLPAVERSHHTGCLSRRAEIDALDQRMGKRTAQERRMQRAGNAHVRYSGRGRGRIAGPADAARGSRPACRPGCLRGVRMKMRPCRSPAVTGPAPPAARSRCRAGTGSRA